MFAILLLLIIHVIYVCCFYSRLRNYLYCVECDVKL